ncbi:MAG: GNAT family N-acetyltransferase [Pyrinomonadaceae bacterium]
MAQSTPAPTLRAATSDDEPFLFEVYAATRLDEFSFLDGSEEQKQALIKMQYDIRRSQYVEGYPQAEASIILVSDRPVGTILIDESDREIVLVDVALLPERRNAGIGSRLLMQLLDRAVNKKKPVRLQVVKSNPALRLYERLGFSRVEESSMYLEMIFEPPVSS